MHTDFNFSKRLDLHRRVNVLYYLNSNYEKAWGGELLLSLSPAREEISAMNAIEPVFNRLVIFNTNDKTFHGHPLPHGFPPGIDLTSLAFYYYSTKKSLSEKNRLATETTKYVPTKDDSIKAIDGSLKSQIGYHLRRCTPFG